MLQVRHHQRDVSGQQTLGSPVQLCPTSKRCRLLRLELSRDAEPDTRFRTKQPDHRRSLFGIQRRKKTFPILYLSPKMHERPYTITLLLLDTPDGGGHYVWVKDLSRLISAKYTHNGAHHACLSCLQVFSSKRVLDEHEPYCLMHAPQQCVYPHGEKAKFSFASHHFRVSL